MKKFYSRRNKIMFPYPELILNFAMVILLLIFHEWVFLSFGILLFLCIHSIMLFVKAGVGKAYYKLKKCERTAKKRLELIREVIDIVYSYSFDEELLERKILKAVKAEKLIDSEIVNMDTVMPNNNKPDNSGAITKDDVDFYCLLRSGFSMRELSVVYGNATQKSLYVRKHRVLKKFEKTKPASPNRAS